MKWSFKMSPKTKLIKKTKLKIARYLCYSATIYLFILVFFIKLTFNDFVVLLGSLWTSSYTICLMDKYFLFDEQTNAIEFEKKRRKDLRKNATKNPIEKKEAIERILRNATDYIKADLITFIAKRAIEDDTLALKKKLKRKGFNKKIIKKKIYLYYKTRMTKELPEEVRRMKRAFKIQLLRKKYPSNTFRINPLFIKMFFINIFLIVFLIATSPN